MALRDRTRKAGKVDGQAPEIEFEREYRDRITGFTGKCTGFTSYISGCDQVLIVPPVDKDGKLSPGLWFDDDRLIDVELEQKAKRSSSKGGPQQDRQLGGRRDNGLLRPRLFP
jgi:hypothetical protein